MNKNLSQWLVALSEKEIIIHKVNIWQQSSLHSKHTKYRILCSLFDSKLFYFCFWISFLVWIEPVFKNVHDYIFQIQESVIREPQNKCSCDLAQTVFIHLECEKELNLLFKSNSRRFLFVYLIYFLALLVFKSGNKFMKW